MEDDPKWNTSATAFFIDPSPRGSHDLIYFVGVSTHTSPDSAYSEIYPAHRGESRHVL